ncbi:MAG: cytochrome c3 family protein [Acidobacteriota bacterium]
MACQECHRSTTGSRQAVAYRLSALSCESCHRNPHQAQSPGLTGADGIRSCETCHGLRSWEDIAAFDHTRTGFPLLGAHRVVACAGCHKRDKASSRLAFEKVRSSCKACHADVHGGQFTARSDGQECSGCHGTLSWKPSLFNHESGTTFSLSGGHAEVACTRCHVSQGRLGGKRIIVYREAPRDCARCHDRV